MPGPEESPSIYEYMQGRLLPSLAAMGASEVSNRAVQAGTYVYETRESRSSATEPRVCHHRRLGIDSERRLDHAFVAHRCLPD